MPKTVMGSTTTDVRRLRQMVIPRLKAEAPNLAKAIDNGTFPFDYEVEFACKKQSDADEKRHDKAARRLASTLEWRDKCSVQNLEKPADLERVDEFEGFVYLSEVNGRPIVQASPRMHDKTMFSKEVYFEMAVYMLEFVRRRSKGDAYMIVDCQDIHKNNINMGLIHMLTPVFKEHYLPIFEKIIVINVNKLALRVYDAIKGILGGIQKVLVLKTGSAEEVLSEYLQPNEIHSTLGGTDNTATNWWRIQSLEEEKQ